MGVAFDAIDRYTGSGEGFPMDEDVNGHVVPKEYLGCMIIFCLIAFGIGAYFGYQNAGVCGAVVAGIFGVIIAAGVYVLGPGLSDR